MAFDPTQPGGRQPDLHGLEEDADIPPPPHRPGAEPLDEDAEERLHRMARRGRALPALLVVAAIGAFGAIVWWAYSTANQAELPGDIPVVEADPGAEKVRPESEGGMDVPNQDKLIYQQLGQSGSAAGEGAGVERLLPPPEEPLEPPAQPPAATEPASGTAGLTPPPPPQDTPDEVVPDTPAGETAALPEGAPAPVTEDATETADAALPAAPAPEPALAAPAPAPADPGPVAEEPAAQQPVPQVAAAGGFRIQLAAVKSEADAEREWARLQQTHAELLGPLDKTIQRAQLEQGVFYRIQGGPLPSREAADTLCAKLKQKNQACLVVKP